MRIRIEIPVYITPSKGQSVYDVAKEIFEAKQEGKIGNKIFLNHPDGRIITLTGETINDIRDSISTQCKEESF